jgi:hypothetical protein
MKLGTENRVELVLAVILGIGAVLSVARWAMSSPSTPTVTASQPTPAQKAPASQLVTNSIDPQLRLDLLKTSEGVHYAGKGRNIFVAGAPPEIPKPIQNPLLGKNHGANPGPPQPQGPPPPPPIELKFFGFANSPGEPIKIFLSHGENIFVAREGDIVERQYRVIKVGTNSVEIEDVLHNNRQSIPLIRG